MAWKLTPSELLARYATGERNFAGVELIREPIMTEDNASDDIYGLQDADLRGINLRGAKLENVILEKTDLSDADLFGACFAGADLSDACLRNANICSANLFQAFCERTVLTRANMRYVNATEASFSGAWISYIEYSNLARANFKDARITDKIICGQFNLIWETILTDGSVMQGPFTRWKYSINS